MARKRMIDPDIWLDSKFLRLKTHTAKLLFIGLFSQADDEGIATADPEEIRARVLADTTREKDLQDALKTIEELELIVKYQINGQNYYFLPNFHKYQQIQYPTRSKNPTPPTEILGKFNEYSMSIQRIFNEASMKPHKKLNESSLLGKVRLSKDILNKDRISNSSVKIGGTGGKIDATSKWYQDIKNDFKDLDVDKELEKIYLWLKDNPRKNHKKTFRNWLLIAQEKKEVNDGRNKRVFGEDRTEIQPSSKFAGLEKEV